jgi:hypothetical protein
MPKNKLPAWLTAPLRSRMALVLAVYLLAWAAALVCTVVQLTADTIAHSTGTLREQRLELAELQPVNAYVEENVLVSENEDPQLLYTVPAGTQLKTLRFAAAYDKAPYERCLYYTTEENGAFSGSRRVWPVENADGSLTFMLPRGVRAVRLDPGSRTDLHVAVQEIVLNEERGALTYFTPAADTLVLLLIVPGLCAAALQCGLDAAGDRRKKMHGTEK